MISFLGENASQTSDDEEQTCNEGDETRENDDADETQLSGIECDYNIVEDASNESHKRPNPQSISRCKRDTSKEDAQIQEFFSMVCEICSDKFETFTKAKTHYRLVHNTSGYLTCCGKKFLRRGRVLDHIYRHLNPDAYRCDPCGKRFADKFALKNHIENHEPLNSRAFKCSLCTSSFTKASKLGQHERLRHCSEEDKKFHCEKCNKK